MDVFKLSSASPVSTFLDPYKFLALCPCPPSSPPCPMKTWKHLVCVSVISSPSGCRCLKTGHSKVGIIFLINIFNPSFLFLFKASCHNLWICAFTPIISFCELFSLPLERKFLVQEQAGRICLVRTASIIAVCFLLFLFDYIC